MSVTADHLRVELGYSVDEWTDDDDDRADAILAGCLTTVRNMVGGHRVDRAIAVDDTDKLDAVDQAVLALATARFPNPERVLQRRQGSDQSVSFADSSESAGNRSEAREILAGAFGMRAGSTGL
jgi:hypothetical protein